MGNVFNWNDSYEYDVSKRQRILDPGIYDFTVSNIEKCWYEGSNKIQPCNALNMWIDIDGEDVTECLTNGTGITENVIIFDTDDSQLIIEKIVPGAVLHMEYYIMAMDQRFLKPLAYEFAMPVDNSSSVFKHLIKGTRPEYISISLS